jgi:hypothetical protein
LRSRLDRSKRDELIFRRVSDQPSKRSIDAKTFFVKVTQDHCPFRPADVTASGGKRHLCGIEQAEQARCPFFCVVLKIAGLLIRGLTIKVRLHEMIDS